MMWQFGQRVYTLSSVVDRFNLKQGNDKGRYYPRMLLFAEWAWKDIFQDTMWEIKKVSLNVCNGKIRLPGDCKLFMSLSFVDDCNRIIKLTYNPNINTLQMKCVKCSCSACHGNCDTLCAVNDNITVTTETITYDDVDYTKTTYTRINSLGEIQTDAHTPIWDVATGTVVYQDIQSSIGSVEVTDKGCIINNPRNVEILKSCCHLAWDVYGWWGEKSTILDPADYNYFGHWNWSSGSQEIIEIFGTGISRVNVMYLIDAERANGNNGLGEMVIPEIAEMAVNKGMLFQQMLFDPRDRDKNGIGESKYNGAKHKLLKNLTKIDFDDLVKIQTRAIRW